MKETATIPFFPRIAQAKVLPLNPVTTTREHLETSLRRFDDNSASPIPVAKFGRRALRMRPVRALRLGWLGLVLGLLVLMSLSASAQTNFTTGIGPVQI